MKQLVFFVICQLGIVFTLLSQNSIGIQAGIGGGSYLNERMGGLNLMIGIQKPVSDKWGIGLGIDAFWSESKGIFVDIENENHNLHFNDYTPATTLIRHGSHENYSEGRYLGAIILDPKPNKMYNFSIQFQIWRLLVNNTKHKVQLGIGLGGSYFDLVHLDSYFRGDFKNPIFMEEIVENQIFTIFRYQSFYDLNINPFVSYLYKINPNIMLGVKCQFLWNVTSNSNLLSFSPYISCDF